MDDTASLGTERANRRTALGSAAILGLGAVLAALECAGPRHQATSLPESARLGHLLRRAGFGATPDELATYERLGVPATVDHLLDEAELPNPVLDRMIELFSFDFTNARDLRRWWLLRMRYSTHQLEERMTLFWHGLLTSATTKARADMLHVQNVFLRRNALGDFPTLLKGISRDPAMMAWLDLQANRKGHANENFARELLELFTMGVGNYTEQDVREAARAFTGYTIKYNGAYKPGVYNPPTFAFDPKLHDDGVKTFLGRSGKFSGDDIIDIIVAQPATANYLCRRLFAWFAYDNPEPRVLTTLTTTYFESHYSIKAVVRAILNSPAFFSPRAYRSTIKSPVDYVVGSLRSLDMLTDAVRLPDVMPAMGQELFNPPNVAGWPGGIGWLNSGTWLARLNYANGLVAGQLGWPKGSGDVARWLEQEAGSTGGAIDLLVRQTLDGQLGAAQRALLREYGADGRLSTAERYRGLTYLALGLPEQHLS